MTRKRLRDYQEENAELREALEEAHELISEALGLEEVEEEGPDEGEGEDLD